MHAAHDSDSCEDVAARLPWLVMSSLSSEDTFRVLTHLRFCPDCRLDLRNYYRLAAKLQRHKAQFEPDCACADQKNSSGRPERTGASGSQSGISVAPQSLPLVATWAGQLSAPVIAPLREIGSTLAAQVRTQIAPCAQACAPLITACWLIRSSLREHTQG